MSDLDQPWPVVREEGAGPAPAPAVRALAQVLRDMQRPMEVPIGVGWSACEAGGWSTLWIQDLADRSITGVSIYGVEHEVWVQQIADQLQEQFFSETVGAWAEARPACPGHPHPCVSKLRGEEAWWRCPTSGTWLARIGTLFS